MNTTSRIYTLDEISAIIKPILSRYNISKAYVFGSYARGEATGSSDIDIYIPRLPDKIGLRYFGMYEDIKESIRKNIDVVTDGSVFASREEKERFFHSINNDKVEII